MTSAGPESRSAEAPPPAGSSPLGSGTRRPGRTGRTALVVLAVLALVSVTAYAAWTSQAPSRSSGGVIQVVAAENFWGSLVAQIGGPHVQVLSIVTDPNADPHEYTANTTDARAVADAQLVIVNGAGYDTWAQGLISASNSPGQVVLNVADLLGQKEGVNPHFWYDPGYVNATIAQMLVDLTTVDKPDSSYFQQQYFALQTSLGHTDARMSEIRAKFGGTHVASTESIFQYLANATGLDLVSPYSFMKAVAEGIDPSFNDITTFYNQLRNDNVSVLVYNEQTVTPLTGNIELNATELHIPIVAVTETIQPPNVPFQTWMEAELIGLENALNQKALGQ
ncbi:MAG: zinc ABC transporter substrate-binding protein [Thermoplasmata archaeon]|nr:zinc ABC transporter substrate-binding protein [Thermoplasmata archaeon]